MVWYTKLSQLRCRCDQSDYRYAVIAHYGMFGIAHDHVEGRGEREGKRRCGGLSYLS